MHSAQLPKLSTICAETVGECVKVMFDFPLP